MTRFEKMVALVEALRKIGYEEDTRKEREYISRVHLDYINGRYVSDNTFNKCMELVK